MLRRQAVGMKSCRPRSGLLTWHPSASTADSLLLRLYLEKISQLQTVFYLAQVLGEREGWALSAFLNQSHSDSTPADLFSCSMTMTLKNNSKHKKMLFTQLFCIKYMNFRSADLYSGSKLHVTLAIRP
jgi:hypothetical protein